VELLFFQTSIQDYKRQITRERAHASRSHEVTIATTAIRLTGKGK